MSRYLVIAALAVLAACAARPHGGPVANLPYCKGTWVSVDAGETYTCLSPKKFHEWRRMMGYDD